MRYDPNEWLEPVRPTQYSLFPKTRKEVLARAMIGEADLYRWNQAGWLSDETLNAEEFDDAKINEVCFVRDLATSGLFTDDIDRILLQLPKPYSYDPSCTAYSFRYGWVRKPPSLTPYDYDEFMEENLGEWLMEKALLSEGNVLLSDVRSKLDRAQALCNQTMKALTRARLQSEDE